MQPATPASAWQSISRETENATMVGAVPAILPRPCRRKKPGLSGRRDSRRLASRGGGDRQPP